MIRKIFLQDGRGGYPGYVPFLTVVTLVYLVFELGFNARLLDVTGQQTNEGAVHAIEVYGRILSGFAVTLLLWSPILKYGLRRFAPGVVGILLFLCAGVVIPMVYRMEAHTVDAGVNESSGEQRRTALLLQTVLRLVYGDTIVIDNIQLTPDIRRTPAGKAMLAVFPEAARQLPVIDQKALSVLEEALRQQAIKTLGTAEHDYNKLYRDADNKLDGLYNQYVRLVNQYHDNLNRVGGPRTAYGARFRAEYQSASARLAGRPLRDDLGFHAFAMTEGINLKFRQKLLQVAGSDPVFMPRMAFPAYKRLVWEPVVSDEVTKTMSDLKLDATDFADGGSHEQKGRDAMEACLAPPLALLFSILGSLFHGFKVLLYGSTWLFPRVRSAWRWGVLLACAAWVVYLPFSCPNTITLSQPFQYMVHHMGNRGGETGHHSIQSLIFTWIVQVQPYAYPVNEFIREIVLHDITYGAIVK